MCLTFEHKSALRNAFSAQNRDPRASCVVEIKAQVTREKLFYSQTVVNRSAQLVRENAFLRADLCSKIRNRLLVIARSHHKLLSARVRMLLVIGVFRVRLTAYTHRKPVIFAEIAFLLRRAP